MGNEKKVATHTLFIFSFTNSSFSIQKCGFWNLHLIILIQFFSFPKPYI